MEWMKVEWLEAAKLIGSGLFGFLTSAVVFLWKERKENRKAAHDAYEEALSIAAKNREAAMEGVMMLYEIVQEIQGSPRGTDLVEIRKSFQIAAASIAEPNGKAAEEFYQELYSLKTEPDLKTARLLLKKAKHFLANNETANRSMARKLSLVRGSLQLGIKPEAE